MGCTISKHKLLVKDNQNTIYDHQIYKQNEECCICLDNQSNILLLPCNHMCICNVCINMINNRKCPICITDIYSYNVLHIVSITNNTL